MITQWVPHDDVPRYERDGWRIAGPDLGPCHHNNYGELMVKDVIDTPNTITVSHAASGAPVVLSGVFAGKPVNFELGDKQAAELAADILKALARNLREPVYMIGESE